MPPFKITGRVVLETETIAELEEAPDEQHAVNILKGGFYKSSTTGISAELEDVEQLEEAEL